jgi:hypothetical protein
MRLAVETITKKLKADGLDNKQQLANVSGMLSTFMTEYICVRTNEEVLANKPFPDLNKKFLKYLADSYERILLFLGYLPLLFVFLCVNANLRVCYYAK